MRFLKEESSGLFRFLRNNGNEAVITASATLFLILDRYHPVRPDWLGSLFYLGMLPLLVILFVLRKNPMYFGLKPGNARVWGVHVLVVCLVSAAVLYVASFNSSLRKYYLIKDFEFPGYFLTSVAMLLGTEFIYRGYLLFGLKNKFGEGSILLQMIPFALLHITKPELETISTVITGVLFGYVACRGKSFWPAFLIHLFINVFFVGLVNSRVALILLLP